MNQKFITLNEASKYLKLTPDILKEMVKEGIFSTKKSGRTVKIDKNEIEEWLANLNESEEELFSLRRIVCRFQDYFSTKNIVMDFKAENKYEAIAEMAKFAKEMKIVRDHRWLYEVVVAREELVSTAIGKGVALLHPRHVHPAKIKKPSILFGRFPDGVDFDAPDNKPVKYCFILLLHNQKQHLFSLSYINMILGDSEKLALLEKSESPEEIYSIFIDNN